MLRAHRFLPSQLRAAYEIAERELDGGRLSNREVLVRWFGHAREFRPRPGAARTPLVNNIVAAAAFVDQHGRVYAYADPSDHEYEPDPERVPDILFTDRLFVAIPNAVRHAANIGSDADVAPGALRLPDVDEELELTPAHLIGRTPPMRASVFETLELAPRISSGFIQIDGMVEVRIKPPHDTLEALIAAAA